MYESIKKFRHHVNSSRESFLPLMQSNDVFIVSVILKGLINHVIWIQPTWNKDSRITEYANSYVGSTIDDGNETIVCMCQKTAFKAEDDEDEFECTIPGENENGEDEEIPEEECHKLKSFSSIIINEKQFLKQLKLHVYKNIILDIDEDYFGTESGVQNYIEKGVSLNTTVLTDEYFPYIFCPYSNEEEEYLNEAMHRIFDNLARFMREEKSGRVKTYIKSGRTFKEKFAEKVSTLFLNYVCKTSKNTSMILNEIANYLIKLDIKEIESLSKVNYCLRESPQLKLPPQFTLCHGNNYPGDTLNQIYVSSSDTIVKRAMRLRKILRQINYHEPPKLCTIARSLRDGYTPRDQQNFIEKTLLDVITKEFKIYKLTPNIIYDKYLLFGKKGWK